MAGPFHIKRISAVTESKEPGASSQITRVSGVPISFYNYLDMYVANFDTVLFSSSEDFLKNDKTKNVSLELTSSGIYYIAQTPIFLENYNNPIGLIGIYYSKEEYDELGEEYIKSKQPILMAKKYLIEYEFFKAIQEHAQK